MVCEMENKKPVNRGVIYAVLFSLGFSIIAAVVCIVYTGVVDRESNQQWCALVVLLDDTYSRTPPTTEVGRQVAQTMHTLRNRFEC